jgi:hypothetical protein
VVSSRSKKRRFDARPAQSQVKEIIEIAVKEVAAGNRLFKPSMVHLLVLATLWTWLSCIRRKNSGNP